MRGGGPCPCEVSLLPPLDPSPLTSKGLCLCSYPVCFLYHQILPDVGFLRSADRPAPASPILAPWPSALPAPSQPSSPYTLLGLLSTLSVSSYSPGAFSLIRPDLSSLPALPGHCSHPVPGHPRCPPQVQHGSLRHLLLSDGEPGDRSIVLETLLLASLMTEKGRVCVKAGKGMCLGRFVAWVMKGLSWRQGMKVGRVIRKRIHKRSGLESGQSGAPLMIFREQ